MSFAPPTTTKPPQLETMPVRQWTNGVISALDDGRMPVSGLSTASNVMLNQDGTIRPMPSLQKYGVQPTGTILGRTFRFARTDGYQTSYYKCNLQKVTVNEIQTLSMTGTPNGGTFTLTFDSKTTEAIAYNATANDVRLALVGLDGVANQDVACAGGDLPDNDITITFQGQYTGTEVELLTSTDSLTGGTTPATSITATTTGSTTTSLYVLKPNEASWSKCTGHTFDDSAYGRFCQIRDKVVITCQTDNLAYLDLSTLGDTNPSVVTFTYVDDPSAPTLSANNAPSGSDYSVWYAIYATSTVGTTKLSDTLKVDVGKARGDWAKDGSNTVKIKWAEVPGATSITVCAGVTKNGENNVNLFVLSSGLTGSATSFTDDGLTQLIVTAELPDYNSTQGPVCEKSIVINDQVWLTGDKNSPFTIWRGGKRPGFELDFTSNDVGGQMIIGGGNGGTPTLVWNFRGGQGDTEIKCLTKEVGAQGKRYTISSHSITYNNIPYTIWKAEEDYGYTGSDSPDGLIVFENSSYYPSRSGFQTSGTKPQLQNLLSTTSISQTIEPTLGKINWDAMGECMGFGWQGRLYWTLPVNASHNNQIWVQDLQRGGAWMEPLHIAADDIFLDIDDAGYSHIVIVQNNTFYEWSYRTLTTIDAAPFITSGSSGLIYFSKDGQKWVNLYDVKVEILRLKGDITFTINGYTEDEQYVPLAKETLSGVTETVGYGYDESGYNAGGFNDFEDAPEATGKRSQTLTLDINENVRYFSFSWQTAGSGVDYNISLVTPEFISIGIKT
jgi:hypothetical protein